MSTHVHLVVTDPLGRQPDFLAVFRRLVALATKVLRKWEGTLWDSEQVSVVRLETREAVIDKIGHAVANPVAAGLVHRDYLGADGHLQVGDPVRSRYVMMWSSSQSTASHSAGGVDRF